MSNKKTKKKKYYLVVSDGSNFTYGAFEHTEEGLEEAESYLKKIKKDGNDYSIIEK